MSSDTFKRQDNFLSHTDSFHFLTYQRPQTLKNCQELNNHSNSQISKPSQQVSQFFHPLLYSEILDLIIKRQKIKG